VERVVRPARREIRWGVVVETPASVCLVMICQQWTFKTPWLVAQEVSVLSGIIFEHSSLIYVYQLQLFGLTRLISGPRMIPVEARNEISESRGANLKVWPDWIGFPGFTGFPGHSF
jgi:hypothetical protein